MSGNNSDEEGIGSSVIGTKDYWNECYEREIENYRQFGDFGEIWFGFTFSQRIVDWISSNCDKQCTRVLDIGCGNGYLLLELAKQRFQHLFGVDYSQQSISFCRQMADKELKTKEISIDFQELDVLSDDSHENSFVSNHRFDCLIDKGTYDAICLMPDIDVQQIRDKYRRFVSKVLSEKSIFILNSCNFTEKQLFKDLRLEEWFEVLDRIESQKFSFGGHVGSQVTGLILRKL